MKPPINKRNKLSLLLALKRFKGMSRLLQGLSSWFLSPNKSLEQKNHVTVLILVIRQLRASAMLNDLHKRSTSTKIRSRSEPFHTKTILTFDQHNAYNKLRAHWVPAVSTSLLSPWRNDPNTAWSMTYVALALISTSLLTFKSLCYCCTLKRINTVTQVNKAMFLK